MRALVIACSFVGAVAHADPLIGDGAPVLGLPTLEARTAERAVDKPTIVDFSATWCEPCHEALAQLAGIVGALGARVQLVVVDVGEPLETVRAYYAAHPPPPGTIVALDLDGAAAKRWGHHRYPTTFVLDRAGVIRFINRGYGPGYGARIETRVRRLLDDPR
jgi:thiol-disulfide isomerase/thioredoxin